MSKKIGVLYIKALRLILGKNWAEKVHVTMQEVGVHYDIQYIRSMLNANNPRVNEEILRFIEDLAIERIKKVLNVIRLAKYRQRKRRK